MAKKASLGGGLMLGLVFGRPRLCEARCSAVLAGCSVDSACSEENYSRNILAGEAYGAEQVVHTVVGLSIATWQKSTDGTETQSPELSK
jgi:hypothetical protein